MEEILKRCRINDNIIKSPEDYLRQLIYGDDKDETYKLTTEQFNEAIQSNIITYDKHDLQYALKAVDPYLKMCNKIMEEK